MKKKIFSYLLVIFTQIKRIMLSHRIRGVSKIKKIRLNNSYHIDLVIDLSSGIMNQFQTILKVKEIIDSSPNYKKNTKQVHDNCKNDNNPEVDTCVNAQIENPENGSNSNNKLPKPKNNENYIDLSKEFDKNEKAIQKNKIEDFLSFNAYFEQYESDIGFSDDDLNDMFSDDDFF